jgi:trehalose/maltose hydrolase-like predicted phosphorylase
VSAAIPMTIMKYLEATNDTWILDARYQDVLIGVANFLLAKSTFNQPSKQYEFKSEVVFCFFHANQVFPWLVELNYDSIC